MTQPMLLANIDVTEVLLYLFFGFFFGLILYLRREDRREGYPLEEDTTGRVEPIQGFLWFPEPKTFRLAHDHGTVSAPASRRESRDLKAKRTAVWPGAPIEPTGDPLSAGVGPGAYAQRAKTPDVTLHGDPKIVPMRVAKDFSIAEGDPDPRGWPVIAYDGRQAGVISDLWIDRAESLIRYIEVELGDAAGEAKGRKVLTPMTMAAAVRGMQNKFVVDAVTAAQFAGAPALSNPDQITMDEEERVAAYFGAGYLYATATRAEPLV